MLLFSRSISFILFHLSLGRVEGLVIIRYTDGSTYEGPYVDDTCLDMLGQVCGSVSDSGSDRESVGVCLCVCVAG